MLATLRMYVGEACKHAGDDAACFQSHSAVNKKLLSHQLVSAIKSHSRMNSLSTLAGGYAQRLCIIIVAICSLAGRTQAATFHGLGTLPGGDYSFAKGLSGDGKVAVGNATVPYGDFMHHHSFRWTEASGMQSLIDIQTQGFIDDTNVVGQFRDEAIGVSGDGALIFGMLDTMHPYVWNESSGFQQLPTPNTNSTHVAPYGISLDGSIIVGYRDDVNPPYALWWTNMDGPGAIFGDDQTYNTAVAISDDGSVITGQEYTNGVIYTYRWTVGSGVELLDGDSGVFQGNAPQGMSRDGTVVVGYAYTDNLYLQMYRWTADTGLVALGDAPVDAYVQASGVSNDGKTVVGGIGSMFNWDSDTADALIWRPQWGLRHLQDVLTNDYHLDLTGWQLTSARAVSTNGTVILGNGINPSGQMEAWIATIDLAGTTLLPRLNLQMDNNNCVLMWPTNATGFVLEQSTDGTLTNWTTISTLPAVVGTQFAVTNPISTTSAYFRLRSQ